jgi:hypothetical protein
MIVPTGSVIRSRREIHKRLLEERNGRLKESRLSNTVEHVLFLDANTAVRGNYILEGMKLLASRQSNELKCAEKVVSRVARC